LRTYLVYFEFMCGEFGQPFEGVFEAETELDLRRKIDDYLSNYYEGEHEKDGNVYLYHFGEVAVKVHGWEEFDDPEYVIQKLKV